MENKKPLIQNLLITYVVMSLAISGFAAMEAYQFCINIANAITFVSQEPTRFVFYVVEAIASGLLLILAFGVVTFFFITFIKRPKNYDSHLMFLICSTLIIFTLIEPALDYLAYLIFELVNQSFMFGYLISMLIYLGFAVLFIISLFNLKKTPLFPAIVGFIYCILLFSDQYAIIANNIRNNGQYIFMIVFSVLIIIGYIYYIYMCIYIFIFHKKIVSNSNEENINYPSSNYNIPYQSHTKKDDDYNKDSDSKFF